MLQNLKTFHVLERYFILSDLVLFFALLALSISEQVNVGAVLNWFQSATPEKMEAIAHEGGLWHATLGPKEAIYMPAGFICHEVCVGGKELGKQKTRNQPREETWWPRLNCSLRDFLWYFVKILNVFCPGLASGKWVQKSFPNLWFKAIILTYSLKVSLP